MKAVLVFGALLVGQLALANTNSISNLDIEKETPNIYNFSLRANNGAGYFVDMKISEKFSAGASYSLYKRIDFIQGSRAKSSRLRGFGLQVDYYKNGTFNDGLVANLSLKRTTFDQFPKDATLYMDGNEFNYDDTILVTTLNLSYQWFSKKYKFNGGLGLGYGISKLEKSRAIPFANLGYIF